MSFLSAENETRLRTAIAEHDLGSVESLIVESAVECATLSTTEPDDYSQPGVSRYGGLPDLPQGMNWPRDTRNRRLSFLLQVNLAEVPSFAGKLVPDQGMLYVFAEDWDLIALFYAPASQTLLPASDLEEEGEDEDSLSNEDIAGLKPYHIAIRATIDLPEWTSDAHSAITDALEAEGGDPDAASDQYNVLMKTLRGKDNSWAGKLQGRPCWIGYVPDGTHGDEAAALAADPKLETEWRLLLLLDTNDAVNMMFGDAGYLQVFIQRDALAQRDFGNLFCQLESS
ncbi:MAG: DUF1963 domain-containing protein [Cytophagales bacterium]|nr:DUF1963 domain-containing protein [Armatimonadota bacterium]